MLSKYWPNFKVKVMSKKSLAFSALLSFAIALAACQPALPPTHTPEPSSTPPSSLSSPTLIPTQMAGALSIITYQMQASPKLEPMLFSSVQGRKFSSEDFSLGDTRSPDLSYFDESQHYCMKKDLDGATLVACQGFSYDGKQGWVKLSKNGSEIYTFDTGSPSPQTTLQGLWVYDHHWVLETAYVTTYTSSGATTIDAAGRITVDGERLDIQKKYDEAFGFQTIAGKPFFLFKLDGKIGFSYDGAETLLDYDTVPNYGCCSMSALNPQAWENHINFFAKRGADWFFVTIGILK